MFNRFGSGEKLAESDPDPTTWATVGVKDKDRNSTSSGSTTRESCRSTRRPSIKTDFSSLFSARACTSEDLVEVDRVTSIRTLPPSYPLPLILFVAFLSIIAGFLVTGVHYAIKYAGCPLGLNGCNSFSGKDYGFFFVRWVRRVTNDSLPEDFVYIGAAFVGSSVLAAFLSYLPPHLKKQSVGGGTVQSLQAVAAGERIPLAAASSRIVSTCIFLGSTGTLGMEGPAIQICTSFSTCIGFAIGMRATATQSLLASLGFAGGFAASFNSPLAGILFAMEELQHISNRVSRHIICVILMASVISTATARACAGNNQLLTTEWSDEIFASVAGGSLNKVFGKYMWMLISVPIGITASFVGCGISRFLNLYQRWIDKCIMKCWSATFVSQIVLAACIGSVVFRITELRGVWGIGYESMQEAFGNDLSASKYFVFTIGKILAMVVSLTVRGPGDILEPVLISGAFFGGGCGRLLQLAINKIDGGLGEEVVQACLVFGMVGLFASCFRFPLTPVLIVLEIMGVETYALLLPAALAGFTAITVSNRLFRPLLDDVMAHDGIDLEASARSCGLAEEEATDDDDDDDNACPSEAEEEPPPESEEKGSEYSGISSRSGSKVSSKDRINTMVSLIEGAMLQVSSPPQGSRKSSKETTGSKKSATGSKNKYKPKTHSRESSRSNTIESHISVGFNSIGLPEKDVMQLHPNSSCPTPGQRFMGTSEKQLVSEQQVGPSLESRGAENSDDKSVSTTHANESGTNTTHANESGTVRGNESTGNNSQTTEQ